MNEPASRRRDELAASLDAVRQRIDRACESADRDPAGVRLIVVTKFFPASDVEHLAALGVRDVGENRDQEAGAKMAELAPQVREQLRCHFIGQLQSNKVNHVVGYADVVHSVDRAKLAKALDRAAGAAGRQMDVLMQIDLGGDDAGRGGVLVQDAPALADRIEASEHLNLRGVMAVAPLGADPAAAFTRLRELSEQLRQAHPHADLISAGMSGDLEQAVMCGATHLRVGSAILGSRPVRR